MLHAENLRDITPNPHSLKAKTLSHASGKEQHTVHLLLDLPDHRQSKILDAHLLPLYHTSVRCEKLSYLLLCIFTIKAHV